MSEQTIVKTEWEVLKNSLVIPFTDGDDSYHGCTLVMAHDKGIESYINLIDSQSKTNLVNYQTEVLKVGSKKFEL